MPSGIASTAPHRIRRNLPRTLLPAPQLLSLAAWLALLVGTVETLILAAQRYVGGQLIFRSEHYLWMPAAGTAVVFLTVALLILLLGTLVPQVRSVGFAVVLFGSLALFSTLMVPRWIHPAAAALLSLGAAIKLQHIVQRPRWRRWHKRTFAPVVLLWLLGLATAFSVPILRERRGIAQLPAANSVAPNIVFIILDTVRARSLSLYGYVRNTTPRLSDFASTGVTFERAIAPSPWTLPTHASMFTGVAPRVHRAVDPLRAFDDRYPTLAEELAKRGYVTAGFMGNLAYGTREFGLGRGFHRWEDYRVGFTEILTNSSLGRWMLLEGYAGNRNSPMARVLGADRWLGRTRSADHISKSLTKWIGERQSDRPFFVFVNFFDAHMPYLPPRPFFGAYGPVPDNNFKRRWRREVDRDGWYMRGNQKVERVLLDRYEESIAYVDEAVGELLSNLKEGPASENTIVVIASDHGEEFGEHGFFEHYTSVYFSQVHVPLIISAPGRVPAGKRIAAPVDLTDLPATLFEVALGEQGVLPGRSMAALWADHAQTTAAPVVSTLEGDTRSQASLITGRWHFIRYDSGEEHLYDHQADPLETSDLLKSPAGAAALPGLRSDLRLLAGEEILQRARPRK